MSAQDNGGPAFPNTIRIDNEEFASLRGMTLRDYFAAKAMQGILSTVTNGKVDLEVFSAGAYAIADAMLKARQA